MRLGSVPENSYARESEAASRTSGGHSDSASWHARAAVSWDPGTIACFAVTWWPIARADARGTREHALSQDQSSYLIFLFVVSAACASIVAIDFVAATIKELTCWPRAWHPALTVAALMS